MESRNRWNLFIAELSIERKISSRQSLIPPPTRSASFHQHVVYVSSQWRAPTHIRVLQYERSARIAQHEHRVQTEIRHAPKFTAANFFSRLQSVCVLIAMFQKRGAFVCSHRNAPVYINPLTGVYSEIYRINIAKKRMFPDEARSCSVKSFNEVQLSDEEIALASKIIRVSFQFIAKTTFTGRPDSRVITKNDSPASSFRRLKVTSTNISQNSREFKVSGPRTGFIYSSLSAAAATRHLRQDMNDNSKEGNELGASKLEAKVTKNRVWIRVDVFASCCCNSKAKWRVLVAVSPLHSGAAPNGERFALS